MSAIHAVFHLNSSASRYGLDLATCAALVASTAVECRGSVAAQLSVEDNVTVMDAAPVWHSRATCENLRFC
jgi:hypothetical protein